MGSLLQIGPDGIEEALKRELLIKTDQLSGEGGLWPQGIQGFLVRTDFQKRDELTGKKSRLSSFQELPPQGRRRDGIDPIEDRIQRSILLEELAGGFFAHAFDAGNIVRTVPDERQVIPDLGRSDAQFLIHGGLIENPILLGVPLLNVRVLDQLKQILVAGYNDDPVAFRRSSTRHLGDQIVRLVTGNLQSRQAVTADELLDVGHLDDEVLGHFQTGRLVGAEELVARVWTGGIEYHTHQSRFLFPHHLVDHLGKAVHGLGGHTPVVGESTEGVEGPVNV